MQAEITILGAGESGVGAARLCEVIGASCRVSDAGSIAPPTARHNCNCAVLPSKKGDMTAP